MARMIISDRQGHRLAPLLPGKAEDSGRTAKANRLFLEAVLWPARTGAPWRDLPEALGNGTSTFRRFRRWTDKGVFERLFQALSADPDFEHAIVAATVVRVHQHASGGKGRLRLRPSAAPSARPRLERGAA